MEIDSGADYLQIERKVEKETKIGESRGIIVEDYQLLNIATHNINGIKANAIKVEILLEWASKEKKNIIRNNEKKTRKNIQQQIIRRIYDCRRKDIKIIVLVDLNDIRYKNLDQSREDSKRTQKLPLLNWLRNSDMVDTFRKLHPYEKKFTRSND